MAAGVCPESPSQQLRDTGVPVVQPQGPFISAQVGRFLEVSWGSADRALLAPGIVMRPQSTGPGLAGHPGSFLSGRCLGNEASVSLPRVHLSVLWILEAATVVDALGHCWNPLPAPRPSSRRPLRPGSGLTG